MSDDEGTESTAQGSRPDDEPTADEDASSSAATGSNEPDIVDERSDVADRGRSRDESTGEPNGERRSQRGPDTADELRSLLDRIAAHDEELAQNVASVVETAREVNETVDHQRTELADLRERNDEQAETIENLHAELSDREDRIDSLESKLSAREERIEELEGALKRKQADFQNYKKRAKKRQEQLKTRATEDLVGRLVGVRDNLKRALEEESDDAGSLREGVDMTLREFDRVLADENVEEIDPQPGSEVDPQRHEVMVQVDSDQPEGTIADVFTPGYEMGEKVIQSAQVTVSNGELVDADTNNEARAAKADEEPDPDDTDGGTDEAPGDWEFDQSIEDDGGSTSDATDSSGRNTSADASMDSRVSDGGDFVERGEGTVDGTRGPTRSDFDGS